MTRCLQVFALLFVLLLAEAPALHAQSSALSPLPEFLQPSQKPDDPVTRADHLEAFFQECSAYEHPVFDRERMEYFCGCMSARIEERFSDSEVFALFENSPAGTIATDRLFIHHYTSCMPEIIENIVLETCFLNMKKQTQIKKIPSVCKCQSQRVKRMFSDNLITRVEQALRRQTRRPTSYEEVLQSYFSSSHFNDDNRSALRQCIYTEEYGWK